MNGVDQYASVSSWNWGGVTTFEALVYFTSFKSYSRIFDFGNGAPSDNAILGNIGIVGQGWFQGSRPFN
jgi:hypothetical protein